MRRERLILAPTDPLTCIADSPDAMIPMKAGGGAALRLEAMP